MSIPEEQLEVWSHQGAITTAQRTHESIRTALSSHQWPEGVNFDVSLQGSYKNVTNVRGDSDVDVVVKLKTTFYHNLTEEERRLLRITPASYRWTDFRNDVLVALRHYYGDRNVRPGKHAVKVGGGNGRLTADVVASAVYREYANLTVVWDDGMVLWSQPDCTTIINYPESHYDNGASMNARTTGVYKPTVRLFKNARNRCIDEGLIRQESCPSYFLECLLYNVPVEKFVNDHQNTYCNVLNWLVQADLSFCLCQNGRQFLFGGDSTQWSLTDAEGAIRGLVDLWNGS